MKIIIIVFGLLIITFSLMAQTPVLPIGEGTEANPYQIATWQNLYWISQTQDAWDKHFIQTADIDFADASPAITTWDEGCGWSPIGNYETDFTGKYNGDNHSISGLFINGNGYKMGLFGRINSSNTEIKNLGLISATVSGVHYIGVLVGENVYGTIRNCYCTGTVNGEELTGGGGLAGESIFGIITDCYSTVTVNGYSMIGGLVGYTYEGTINNSYSTGNVTGSNFYIGGLVGKNFNGSISNSYSTGTVTAAGYMGGLVGYNFGLISNCYSLSNVSGPNFYTHGLVGRNDTNGVINNSYYNYETVLINNSHVITTCALTNELFNAWLPEKSLNISDFLENDGSDYLINNINDFKKLLAFSQFSEYSFKLMNHLDLTTENNFYIPNLSSTFNGNSYTITNLTLNMSDFDNVALFGKANNAHIMNLGLINVNVSGYHATGGLVGLNEGGTITNCYISGTVTGTGNYTGGLVGDNQGEISNCYSTGNMSGGYSTGGLVGLNINGTITNCYNTGSVTATEHCTGGLIGTNYTSTISNCYNTGIVTGQQQTGGLVGSNSGNITNCYSTGTVTGVSITAGLVGYNSDATILKCYSTGTVNGVSKTGGLVGFNQYGGNITNSYCTGNVSGTDFCTGGLVGKIENGNITHSYSTGNVTGTDVYTGGLVGEFIEGIVTYSFWDIETSGQGHSAVGTRKTTAEMKTLSTYTDVGWDFPDVWNINPDMNDGYPYLNYPNSVPNDEIVIETPLCKEAVLHSAYPNPFNPSTTISFDLASPSDVKIDIFNVKGQLVKNLVHKAYQTGSHTIFWDGRDHDGNNCGTGVYFYKMTAGMTTQTKKMMLMK